MEPKVLGKVALAWVLLALLPGSSTPSITPTPSTISTESPTTNTTIPGPSTTSTKTTVQEDSTSSTTTEGNHTTTMSNSTTAQPPSSVTSQTTSTATQRTVPFYLSYHILNREFNDSLLNETSVDYQELNETIGQMYRSIYGCNDTCALRDEYQGYNILKFGPGSVAADTELFFVTRRTPEQLALTAHETFENASTTERQDLNLTSIQGSSTPSITPTPSTISTESPTTNTTIPGPSTTSTKTTVLEDSTSSTTTEGNHTTTMSNSTTAQPPSSVTSQTTSTATQRTVPFYLSYHILNREFNDSLLNETSVDYQELNETIGQMYRSIYGCNDTCALRDEYQGYNILKFGPGSVAADTELFFVTRRTPEQLALTARETFENASTTERQDLNLTSIQGFSTPIAGTNTSEPTTASPQTATPVSANISTESPGTETTTPQPTTASPQTAAPVSANVSTESPSTETTTPQPTTASPQTAAPMSANVSTESPSTETTTPQPTTASPQTAAPVSANVSTESPGTETTTPQPTTASPQTAAPVSTNVSTESPGTETTTPQPTTASPQTAAPVSANVSTESPGTETTTPQPTTASPQTAAPVSANVSTESPGTETTTPGRSTASPETTPSSSKTTPLVGSATSTTEGNHTTATTSSRTTAQPPSSVTSTTTPEPVPFYLAYHITNREFDNTLLDPTTLYYQQMNESIGKMYQNIYGCDTCERRDEYRGYSILQFGPGSVAVWTVLFFRTQEPPEQLAESLREIFERSSLTEREQLLLISIQGSSTPVPIPEPPERVPGWGIALLVLVCILLLFAIIAFLLVIIYRCRRSHRGHLDLLNSRDAYHPMSEYPTYHTHGRYAAPFTKPNPYDKPPTNGTSPFSYTNPAVANDNL